MTTRRRRALTRKASSTSDEEEYRASDDDYNNNENTKNEDGDEEDELQIADDNDSDFEYSTSRSKRTKRVTKKQATPAKSKATKKSATPAKKKTAATTTRKRAASAEVTETLASTRTRRSTAKRARITESYEEEDEDIAKEQPKQEAEDGESELTIVDDQEEVEASTAVRTPTRKASNNKRVLSKKKVTATKPVVTPSPITPETEEDSEEVEVDTHILSFKVSKVHNKDNEQKATKGKGKKAPPARNVHKNLKQILSLEDYGSYPPSVPTYVNIEPTWSMYPKKKYCMLTGLIGKYTDPMNKITYHSNILYPIVKAMPESRVQQYLELTNQHSKIK